MDVERIRNILVRRIQYNYEQLIEINRQKQTDRFGSWSMLRRVIDRKWSIIERRRKKTIVKKKNMMTYWIYPQNTVVRPGKKIGFNADLLFTKFSQWNIGFNCSNELSTIIFNQLVRINGCRIFYFPFCASLSLCFLSVSLSFARNFHEHWVARSPFIVVIYFFSPFLYFLSSSLHGNSTKIIFAHSSL